VYHDIAELTYSVAVNPAVPELVHLSGSVSAVHRKLAEALRGFLSQLGIEAEITARSSSEDSRPDFFHKAPCFASHARHELRCGEKKIVASAQRRVGDALLQHGSIKLRGAVPHAALGDHGPASDLTPQPLEKKQLDAFSPVFAGAFEAALEVTLEPCPCEAEVDAAVRKRWQNVAENALVRRDILCTRATPKQSIT
jgi:hypothetical protein